MSTPIQLPESVEEAAQLIVSEAKRLGVKLERGWWLDLHPTGIKGSCGCACGVLAVMSSDEAEIRKSADYCGMWGYDEIKPLTGLTEGEFEALSDGFEFEPSHHANDTYRRFYTIGWRVSELAGLNGDCKFDDEEDDL